MEGSWKLQSRVIGVVYNRQRSVVGTDDTCPRWNVKYEQQLLPAGTSIICPPQPVSAHYRHLQTLDINLIATFTRPLYTVLWRQFGWNRRVHETLILLSSMDPRRATTVAPPDAKVEVNETLTAFVNAEFWAEVIKG